MNRARKLTLVSLLLLATTGGFIGHRQIASQQERLARQQAEIARIETALRQQRQLLAQSHREHAAIEREIETVRRTQALAEAGSSIKLWANRITLLKRLLEEMPGQAIPELRLLAPIDWVQVVRTVELDRSENLRLALTALRAVGRKKFSEKLQEALRRFTADSAGELPADIRQLAPYLSAPADAEMLQRYAMTRSGRLGAADVILIKELPVADMILSVGLENWNITHNSDWKPPAGESDLAGFSRTMAALGLALDNKAGMEELTEVLSPAVWQKFGERIGTQFEGAFGERFGDDLKGAVKRYGAERAGEVPENFAQLLPYLKDVEKLVPVLRPILAEIEYMLDHPGQAPTDPAQLRRYLEKPFDPAQVLQGVKITVDGDKVTASFGLSWGTP
jgi:hypothetical protein